MRQEQHTTLKHAKDLNMAWKENIEIGQVNGLALARDRQIPQDVDECGIQTCTRECCAIAGSMF